MKNKKGLIICIAVIIAAGLWFWRYSSMNAYYDSFSNITESVYQTGEIVAFGQNRLGDGSVVDGYSVRVDGMKLMEKDEFLAANSTIQGDEIDSERIALVYITLFNDSSDEELILLELMLHGPDNYVGLHWSLLAQLNPELQGSFSIRLEHGQECSLVLPYKVFQRYFGSGTWDDMENYGWMLRTTYWPERIDISVNPDE